MKNYIDNSQNKIDPQSIKNILYNSPNTKMLTAKKKLIL